jgi:hypothetical protein
MRPPKGESPRRDLIGKPGRREWVPKEEESLSPVAFWLVNVGPWCQPMIMAVLQRGKYEGDSPGWVVGIGDEQKAGLVFMTSPAGNYSYVKHEQEFCC